jgi:Protein of unknown function (DUF1569)
MKNLFEPATVDELERRLVALRPDSPRVWGRMTPAQALAHCSSAMEMAMGDNKPPRAFVGRLFGPWAKKSLLVKGRAMSRNAPTDKSLVVSDDRDLAAEAQRLRGLINRFVAGGSASCTSHPHPFFGHMSPQEWSALMYVHLDHHFQQFGV